jgi:hypothetical protein
MFLEESPSPPRTIPSLLEPGPKLGDGYQTALTNFGFLANDVVTTDEAVETMRADN